jgi:hypothetical protein
MILSASLVAEITSMCCHIQPVVFVF